MSSDSRSKRHRDRSRERDRSHHDSRSRDSRRSLKDTHQASHDNRSKTHRKSDKEERSRYDDRRDKHRRSPRESRKFGDEDRSVRPRRDSPKESDKSKDDKSKISREHPTDPEKPNFSLSGKLAEDTNTFNGVVVKYNEPPEAMVPKRSWRLYPFKGDEALPVIYLKKQSAFLLGRDRRVADIPIDHPSCSKQHAALQFRCISYERDDGSSGKRVKPYIIDLGSANGTFLNNQPIEAQRYYELFEKDVIKFGFSSREYVVLTEDCADAGDEESPKQG